MEDVGHPLVSFVGVGELIHWYRGTWPIAKPRQCPESLAHIGNVEIENQIDIHRCS